MTSTMLSKLRQSLAPPTFPDEQKTQLASLQNIIFLGTMVIAGTFGLVTLVLEPNPLPRLLITSLWIPVALGGLFLIHRGYVRQSSILFSTLAWTILTFEAWISGGVMGAGFSSYTVIILVIGMLCGFRVALIFAGLSVGAGLGLLYAETIGILPTPLIATAPVAMWAALATNFIATAVLIYLATGNVSEALGRARDNQAALLTSNRELQKAQAILEDRTAELAVAITILENELTERKQILESLKQSEERLRQFNAELEQRVQERTEELAEANEALVQEIATRQQAEAALKETFNLIERAKQEWEVTADTLPQLVCLFDQQGRIKRANRTVEHWELVQVTEVRNRTLHELLHPDCCDPACYLESLWAQASEALVQGRSAEFEAEDEVLGRSLQLQAQPISIQTGGRSLTTDSFGVVVIQDITERKKAEAELVAYRDNLEDLVNERTAQLRQANLKLQLEIAEHHQTAAALQQSEENFRALADNAQDGFNIISGNEEYVYVNRRFSELAGYSSQALLKKSIKDLVPPDEYEQLSQRYWQHLAGETITNQYETKLAHSSGHSIPVEITAARTVWYGKPAVVVSVRDITERQQAAETLRQERDFAQTLINTAQAIILVLDDQGQIDLFNPYLEQISGYHLEEVRGQDWFSTFLPARDHERIRQLFLQAIDDVDTGGNINPIVTKDGLERQIEWYSKTLKDAQGKTIGLLAVGHDITERLEVEEALRQTERRYRELFEEAPLIYVTTHNQTGAPIISDCNTLFLTTLNYDRTEVIGQPLANFYSPESRATLLTGDVFKRALTGQISMEECQLVTRQGQAIETLLRVVPEVDAQGQVTGARAMYVDITERKQVEQALQESEERFRRVITSISDHIYVTEITASGEHRNLYISPNVENLTGYPAERILINWALWATEVIHPADRAAAAGQLSKLDVGKPSEAEYRLVRADGDVIWVRDSARVEDRDSSRIIYGVINDITARKEAEEVILRYSERLEILRDIERGILSAQSVEAIGQAAMSRIRHLIPCHSATITIFDFAANEALLVTSDPAMTDRLEQELRVKLTHTQVGEPSDRFNKLKQGQVVILGEAQLKQDYEAIYDKSIRSVMVVPLIYQGKLIGTLNLSATESGNFTAAHQDDALQVAGQLAIAISQADLYEQVQRHADELEQRVADRTRELSTLYEITAVASEMIDLQSMLARSLKQLSIALRCQVGIIYLTTEPGGELRMFTQHGLTPKAMAQVEALLLNNQLIKRVFEGGKPVTVPDLTADTHLAESSTLVDLETYAGVPIRAGGQGLGVLNVFGAFKQQFNVEDLALLASVGDQIGVAVENFRLRQQAEQAAVIEERERLARELHDSVTQSLYSLTLFTEGSLELVKNGKLELVEHNLTRIGETAQQALKEMRLLVYELRPLDLEKEGFVGALHQRLATVEKRAGINARLVAEELVELSPLLEKELYRITQEALNNTLKHAEATFIAVYLRVVDGYVDLEIVDNGKGFEPDDESSRGGLGLLSIQERIEKLGGSLDIRSVPGKGTIIHVRVKIN